MSEHERLTPAKIFAQYEQGRAYRAGLTPGLYETVEQNEAFFLGRQWEGLNAPDLDKPVLNILGRVVGHLVSMICADSIGIHCEPFNTVMDDEKKSIMQILSSQLAQIIEDNDMTRSSKDMIRAAAVDGDVGVHAYFDIDADTGQDAKGLVKVEIIQNVREFLGRPQLCDVQKQPYIILEARRDVEEVRREMRQRRGKQADVDAVKPDGISSWGRGNDDQSGVTVLTKYWREDDEIHVTKVTRNAVVMEPTALGYKRYPYARMSWEAVTDCCHGQAAVTGLIPNQIAINKLMAMCIVQMRNLAFPKLIYDATKIPKWDNRIGAIGVNGNPREAVTSVTERAEPPAAAMVLIDTLLNRTRDLMGASDASLGNVRPENTSAIIAVQQSTAVSLEMQRRSFYRMVEELARVFLDIVRVDYGQRLVLVSDDSGGQRMETFDFSTIGDMILNLNIDIGASNYWSELKQVQTIDALYQNGIISDPLTYLEMLPDNCVKDKNRLIVRLKELQQAAQLGAEPLALDGLADAAPGKEVMPFDVSALQSGYAGGAGAI